MENNVYYYNKLNSLFLFGSYEIVFFKKDPSQSYS